LARAATRGDSGSAEEALALLRKDWAASPDVGDVLLPVGLSTSNPAKTEALLREVLARNPSRDARGRAAYALGSLLFSLADHRQPAPPASRDPAALLAEADKLMNRVATEFADVKLHADRPKDTQTLGSAARDWLRQEEGPAVGQVAPAIEGKDLNGQTVRLSDYRGKVVVLVFWAGWCRPCLAMIPEEKALAARLADKPFALLGVNCDATEAEARKVVAARAVPWPNWHDGLPSEGKFAERYRVAGHGIPAVFVIDREGVLRHKGLASSHEIERAVDALLGERGAARK
jgi:peroxiredoxin